MIRKLVGKKIRPKKKSSSKPKTKTVQKPVKRGITERDVKGQIKRGVSPKKVREAAAKKAKEVAAKETKPKKDESYKAMAFVAGRKKGPDMTERDVMLQMKRGVSPTIARKAANKRARKRLAIDIPQRLNMPKKEAEDIITIQILNANKNMSKTEARKLAKAEIKRGENEREVAASFKRGFQDVSDKELKDEASKKSGGKVYKRKKGGKVIKNNTSGQDLVNSCYD